MDFSLWTQSKCATGSSQNGRPLRKVELAAQESVVAKLAEYERAQKSQSRSLGLSLPRVISFKFPLLFNQKYYITQYVERGHSWLTLMKDDYTANSHYLIYTLLLNWGWQNVLFELGSERVRHSQQTAPIRIIAAFTTRINGQTRAQKKGELNSSCALELRRNSMPQLSASSPIVHGLLPED